MTRKLVVVSAGLSDPSSTRLLADLLADATTRALTGLAGVEIRSVELRPLAHALADQLLTGFATGELAEAEEAVAQADAVIAVTPVFSASYSGLFKTFFDVLEPDLLTGIPVLIGATAGTARHSLVLEHALRLLFSYLHATVVPTAVFAASEDFGEAGLQARVDRAAGELAALLSGAPRQRARSVEDEFADPTPFEDLLRGA